MITLYLLRHAKASQSSVDGRDESRPLNNRGRGASEAIGRYMREAAWRPSLVLCSTAKRSRETLALLAGAAGWETEDPVVQYSDRLYLAAPEETISQLQELDGSVASVLVVGHNPGFHDISLMLADPESVDYARLLENFPTGALAVLRDDSKSWRSLGTSKMELLRFLVPRELVP